MQTIVCLYCQNDIDVDYQNRQCPYCGKFVVSAERMKEAVDAVIWLTRNKGLFDALKVHIYNHEDDRAINIIRSVTERQDSAVEQKVIERILKDKPADWTPVAALKVSIPIPVSNAPALVSCKACNNQISNHAKTCPHCGHPTGVHVCPKCGSIKTKVISGASKTASIFFWGAYAANKVRSTYECLDCKHKW